MADNILVQIKRELTVSKKIGLLDFYLAEEIIVKAIRSVWPNINKALAASLIGITKQKFLGPTDKGIVRRVNEIIKEYEDKPLGAEPGSLLSPTEEEDVEEEESEEEDPEESPESSESKDSTPARARKDGLSSAKATPGVKKKGAAAQPNKRARVYGLDTPARAACVPLTSVSGNIMSASKASAAAATTCGPPESSKAQFRAVLNDLFSRNRVESTMVDVLYDALEDSNLVLNETEVGQILKEMEASNQVMVHEGTVYR
eukprot:gene9697-11493_t